MVTVGVIGGGAVGVFLATRLSRSPEIARVFLQTKQPSLVSLLSSSEAPLSVQAPDGKSTLRSGVVRPWKEDSGEVDVALFCVKSPMAKTAAQMLPSRSTQTVYVALQNGLGASTAISEGLGGRKVGLALCVLIARERVLKDIEQVLRGVLSHGIRKLRPGAVAHAGEGDFFLEDCVPDGRREAYAIVSRAMGALTESEGSFDIHDKIWEKLFMNLGINAITALLRVRNKHLSGTAPCRAVMASLVREAHEVSKRVAIAEGKIGSIVLEKDVDTFIQRVYDVANITGENQSSTLQDVLFQRDDCEINFLNGAIVRLGQEHGVLTPYNDCVTRLVQARIHLRHVIEP